MAPKKNDPRDVRATRKSTAKKDEKPMRPTAGAQKRQPSVFDRDDRFGEEE